MSLLKEEERYCSTDGICNASPLTDSSANGWSGWSQWDACSVECGGGYQTMTRTCLKPPCQGSTNVQRACNVHSCIGENKKQNYITFNHHQIHYFVSID